MAGMRVLDKRTKLTADGTTVPVVNARYRLFAATEPLFLDDPELTRRPLSEPIEAVWSTLPDGTIDFTIPWPSQGGTGAWGIEAEQDGRTVAGLVPEGVAGPFTIKELIDVVGWGIVPDANAPPIVTAVGPPGMVWRGEWTATPDRPYMASDAVFFNGSTWICTVNGTTLAPSVGILDWNLMAEQGVTGAYHGMFEVIDYASFDDAVATLTSAFPTSPATLVVSDTVSTSNSQTVPSNLTLSVLGTGKITVIDQPSSGTLVAKWSGLIATTKIVPGGQSPPATMSSLDITGLSTYNAASGPKSGDTVVLGYTVAANGQFTLVSLTVTGWTPTGDGTTGTLTFSPFSNGGADAITFLANAPVSFGYIPQGSPFVTGSRVFVPSLAGLQLGDEVTIGDNGTTLVRVNSTKEQYSPDTGERGRITAITPGTDAGGNPIGDGIDSITIAPGFRAIHRAEPYTSHRMLTINGTVTSEPSYHIFDASANGENGFGRVQFAQGNQSQIWAEWFGARGDVADATRPVTITAATDSTDAINAAIQSVPAFGGVDVCFNGAAYKITKPLDIRNTPKYNYRNSMRFFGRAALNDFLPQGPTTFVWAGNATDPMIRLWSAYCFFDGIWFTVGNSFICNILVDIDRGGAFETCTLNYFRGCTFGVIRGAPLQKHYTGVRVGFRNQNNCDFMTFERCTFTCPQPDNPYNPTPGTGTCYYVPNTTQQAAQHNFYTCRFSGDTIYPGVPSYTAGLHAIYFVSGHFNSYRTCCYFIRTCYRLDSMLSDIHIIGGDHEACQQMTYVGFDISAPLTISGTRFACNFIKTDPAPGMEFINCSNGPLELQGCIINPGLPGAINPCCKIKCSGSVRASNTVFPNANPFDMTVPVNVTMENCRIKTGGQDKDVPRAYLQGNNQAPASAPNDGHLWLNSPVGIAPLGNYQLTPPGPVTIFQPTPLLLTASSGIVFSPVPAPTAGGSMAAGSYLVNYDLVNSAGYIARAPQPAATNLTGPTGNGSITVTLSLADPLLTTVNVYCEAVALPATPKRTGSIPVAFDGTTWTAGAPDLPANLSVTSLATTNGVGTLVVLITASAPPTATTGVVDIGYHWYTFCRVTKEGIEQPVGTTVTINRQTAWLTQINMPPITVATDVAWTFYRAPAPNLNTPPSASAFRYVGKQLTTGAATIAGGPTNLTAGSGGTLAAVAHTMKCDIRNQIGRTTPSAAAIYTPPAGGSSIQARVTWSNVATTGVGIYLGTTATPQLVGVIPVSYTPATSHAPAAWTYGALPAGIRVVSLTTAGQSATLTIDVSALGTGDTGAVANTTGGGQLDAYSWVHLFIDNVTNAELATRPQLPGQAAYSLIPTDAPTVTPIVGGGAVIGGTHCFCYTNIDGSGNESFGGVLTAPTQIAQSGHATVTVPDHGSGLTHHVYASQANAFSPLFRITPDAGPIADGGSVNFGSPDITLATFAPANRALPPAAYHYLLSTVDVYGNESNTYTSDNDTIKQAVPGIPTMVLPAWIPGSKSFKIYRAQLPWGQDIAAPNWSLYSLIATVPSLTPETQRSFQYFTDGAIRLDLAQAIYAGTGTPGPNPPSTTNVTAPPMLDVRGTVRGTRFDVPGYFDVEAGTDSPPLPAPPGFGRISYDPATNHIIISENGSAYQVLLATTSTDVIYAGALISTAVGGVTFTPGAAIGTLNSAQIGPQIRIGQFANHQRGYITVVAGKLDAAQAIQGSNPTTGIVMRVFLFNPAYTRLPGAIKAFWGSPGTHNASGTNVLLTGSWAYSNHTISFDIRLNQAMIAGNTYDICYEISM